MTDHQWEKMLSHIESVPRLLFTDMYHLEFVLLDILDILLFS